MGEIINAFGVDVKLILVQMLNFGLLLVALWYFLYTPILNILNERQQKSEKGVKDAESAGKALESADTERKKRLSVAHHDAEEVGVKAKAFADEKSVSIVSTAQAKADDVIKDAQSKGEEIKVQALKESEAEIAKISILAAEKVLRVRSVGDTSQEVN